MNLVNGSLALARWGRHRPAQIAPGVASRVFQLQRAHQVRVVGATSVATRSFHVRCVALEARKTTPSVAADSPSVTKALLDHNEFAKINHDMQRYDETREQIIKRSREILKSSKHAIYSLHRGDHAIAAASLEEADKVIAELIPMTSMNPSLRHGALSASLEEYAEAKCFAHYLATHCLLPLRAMPHLDADEYLGGVADFTGELTRYAVVRATSRDDVAVEKCRAMVEAISGELIRFDFRNGPLRKKYDAVKYNLRKLENTLYELSLIKASGLKLQVDSTAADADTTSNAP